MGLNNEHSELEGADNKSVNGNTNCHDGIIALYERESSYSDYLNGLQRSAQRYYYILFSAVGVVILQLLLKSVEPCVEINVILYARWGAIIVFLFGFITIMQLASLRALNLITNARTVVLRNEILKFHIVESKISKLKEDLCDYENSQNPFSRGNDWIKVIFVVIGNTICVYFLVFHIFESFNLNRLLCSVSLFIFLLASIEITLLLYGLRFMQGVPNRFKSGRNLLSASYRCTLSSLLFA